MEFEIGKVGLVQPNWILQEKKGKKKIILMKKNIVDWKPLSVITLRQKVDDNKCYNISKTILLVFVLYWNWDFVNLGNIDHTIQMEAWKAITKSCLLCKYKLRIIKCLVKTNCRIQLTLVVAA